MAAAPRLHITVLALQFTHDLQRPWFGQQGILVSCLVLQSQSLRIDGATEKALQIICIQVNIPERTICPCPLTDSFARPLAHYNSEEQAFPPSGSALTGGLRLQHSCLQEIGRSIFQGIFRVNAIFLVAAQQVHRKCVPYVSSTYLLDCTRR